MELGVVFSYNLTIEERSFYMSSNKRFQLYFAGFFAVFPIIFIISSIFWRAVILDKDFAMVATDAFSIVGIYYLIISIIFIFVYRKNIKSLLS